MVAPLEFTVYIGRRMKDQQYWFVHRDIRAGSEFTARMLDVIVNQMVDSIKTGERILLVGPCPRVIPYVTHPLDKDCVGNRHNQGFGSVDYPSAGILEARAGECAYTPAAQDGLPEPLTPRHLESLQALYGQRPDVKQYPDPFLYQPRR